VNLKISSRYLNLSKKEYVSMSEMIKEDQDTEAELQTDESEVVEEATEFDGKNAEADAVKAVKKAEADGPAKGTPPGGPGGTAEAMPKTKAGIINAMYGKLNQMKKPELAANFDKMMGKGAKVKEDVDGEELEALPEYNYSGELDALVESEATLSEEFKAKTAIIFEAALKSKLSMEIDRLEENYTTELEEAVTEQNAAMVDKVDSYLNYVVENWMDENKLQVQAGLRTEIAESFMTSLKDLFTESYITVPDSKVDLVDEQSDLIAELEEKLNDQTGKSIAMAEEIENFKREAIISEASKGLADTQVEKLKQLTDDVTFQDEKSFDKKVSTIKETYFKPNTVKSTESFLETESEDEGQALVEDTGAMSKYLTAIRKSAK
tara:strand:+ start:6679 stop:7815 length:1137 start_codon:yes stop_codon:yes gene_type:complete